MIIYNVQYRDYKNKSKEMIGVLTERRKDPRRGSTLIQSALKWAKIEFGQLVKDANAIFIEKTLELIRKNPYTSRSNKKCTE